MLGLLVTGHGYFATGLNSSLELIAGTNLPLLIASSTMTAVFESPLDLAEAMIPEGKDSIVRFEFVPFNNEPEDDEDGI